MTGRSIPIRRILRRPRMTYCPAGHVRSEDEEQCGRCRLDAEHARQRHAEALAWWLWRAAR